MDYFLKWGQPRLQEATGYPVTFHGRTVGGTRLTVMGVAEKGVLAVSFPAGLTLGELLWWIRPIIMKSTRKWGNGFVPAQSVQHLERTVLPLRAF